MACREQCFRAVRRSIITSGGNYSNIRAYGLKPFKTIDLHTYIHIYK